MSSFLLQLEAVGIAKFMADRGSAPTPGSPSAVPDNIGRRSREALHWSQIVESPEFGRWEEFTRWLEEHPGNLRLYEFWIQLQGAKPIPLEKPDREPRKHRF
jgi:ferric-dicitrate binding protein FerR (iron transport regulator)